jgi:hypothetical protein
VERLVERLKKLLADVASHEALWRGCAACLSADACEASKYLHFQSRRSLRTSALRFADA